MDSTGPVTTLIGERVRSERQARQWTLDRLVEVSGESRRMLINMEQGAANPSTGVLLTLSDALGVGLAALVEQPGPTAAKVTRSGEGPVLWSSEAGGSAVLVARTVPPDVVELREGDAALDACADELVAHLARLGPDVRVDRRLPGPS